MKTFAALDEKKRGELTRELEELMLQRNRSGDATLVVPSEYLETVMERITFVGAAFLGVIAVIPMVPPRCRGSRPKASNVSAAARNRSA